MVISRRLFILAALLFAHPTEAIDFNRDVRPILSDRCFACHGPDEHDRKAGLRLDTLAGATEDLGGYAALVPGNLEESEAWQRILSTDPDEVMPPPELHKPLKDSEKEILKKWILQGGEYEMHWSYQPLEKPAVPDSKLEHPVDRFIAKRLAEAGLQLSDEADRVTLIRRLSLDLTGLPPRPEDVDRFVQDPSPDAYGALVKRLLESPAFGERMAVFWLDLVRYADTIGYHSDNVMEVSAYRDYVIEAFRNNHPYDQFVIEQLAGDLLPDPAQSQLVASGYNRLLQSTEEGGAQAKEYIAIHAADRVRNVSEVFLGSTLGCAQCHDHKYDPFTMRDFYAFAAFFADVKEKPIGKRQPNLRLPTAEETATIARLRKEIEEGQINRVLQRDPDLAKRVDRALAQWIEESRVKAKVESEHWESPKPLKVVSRAKSQVESDASGQIKVKKGKPNTDVYTVEARPSGAVTGFRLQIMTDPGFVRKAFTLGGNGNFVLTEVVAAKGEEVLPIASAQSDFTQDGYPVALTLDGNKGSGWAGGGHQANPQTRTAVFTFANPVSLGEGESLSIRLHQESKFGGHVFSRFRLSFTTVPEPVITESADLPAPVIQALQAPEDEKTRKLLSDHFRAFTPLLAAPRNRLAALKKEVEGIEKGVRTMLVSESLPEPRMTRILDRGNWMDESGEIVEPAFPAFLPHETVEGRRANRLDLANWMMSPDNPLPARTMTNRLWKLFFGQGLSTNLGDLGGQGTPPTHPELLDWLASQFRDSGWNVKELITLMVTSKTYRQSSSTTPEMRTADPNNAHYARQGRWRIDAEFVRDSALYLSGLLSDEMCGPSVKPYQPAGYWQHLNFPRRKWEPGSGEDLYRRSLYTFWCRSFLHPAMLAFDAPSREECTAERARSNIPQQALVLLNDPQFVESSRGFAARIVDSGEGVADRIDSAWEMAVSRKPSSRERSILQQVYDDQLERFQKDPAAADAFLGIGASPLPEGLGKPELAAWTQVARTILNAYEVTSRF